MRHIHNRRLAARNAIYQVDLLDQADAAATAVDRAIAALWSQLLAVIGSDFGPSHNYQRSLLVLRQFPFLVSARLRADFGAIFHAGHAAAADATIDVLPLAALRQMAPGVALLEDEPAAIRPGLISILPSGPEPVARMPKSDEQKQAIRSLMFPAPSADTVLRRLGNHVAPAGWQDLGDGVRKLPADLAQAIAVAISQGKGQKEVANEILPHFEGSRVRARRTARTFGMLVSHEGRMAAYLQMGDIVEGYQVHATHDQHTRKKHAARDGNTYYRNPGPGQRGFDQMPRPPLEADGSIAWHCRCWLTPVLKPLELTPEKQAIFTNAQGKLVPDPVDYSAWFDGAPERNRATAIGVRRYYTMKEKLATSGREPEYADFLDPDDGDLLAVKRIDGESLQQHAERRQQVDRLIAARQDEIRKVYTFGFVTDQPLPPAAPAPTPTPVSPAPLKLPPVPPAKPSTSPGPLPPMPKRLEAYKAGDRKVQQIVAVGRKVEKLHARTAELAKQLDGLTANKTTEPTPRLQRQIERLADRHEKAIAKAKQAQKLKAAQAHAKLHVDEPATSLVQMARVGPEVKGIVQKAVEFFDKVLGANPGDPTLTVKVKKVKKCRAYQQLQADGSSLIVLSPAKTARVAVHEMGHAIELQFPGALQAARDFLAHRVGNQPQTKLKKLFPGHGFDASEFGRDDHFGRYFGKGTVESWYCGKHYDVGTEIISMGLEALYHDPVGFASKDPEYCKFILGILDGTLRR